MAQKHIKAFELALRAHENATNITLQTKKQTLLSYIEELRKLVPLVTDVYNTLRAVYKLDEGYYYKLRHYLIGYDEKNGYDKTRQIEADSYDGFHANGYQYEITINRFGVSFSQFPCEDEYEISTQDTTAKLHSDNAVSFINKHTTTEEHYDNMINNAKRFLEHFPPYAQKFFDLVENPKFD